MEFVPVQIQNQNMNLHNGSKILFQIWNSAGQKIFQKRLQKPITQWAICFDIMIFKTNRPDADWQYFQIINLRTLNVTLIKDFTDGDTSFKYLAYNNGKFYVANQTCIKVIGLKITNAISSRMVRDIDPGNIGTIQLWNERTNTGNRIHGLALTKDCIPSENNTQDFVYVFIEIFGKKYRENKISMNELHIEKRSLPPYKFDYKFVESREYVLLDEQDMTVMDQTFLLKADPIVEYQFIFNKNNIHSGVARKVSGEFDIYYNGNFIDDAKIIDEESSLRKKYKCSQMTLTYNNILFEITNLTDKDKIKREKFRTLDLNSKFENNKPIVPTLKSQARDGIFFTDLIKNHCNLYSGIIMIWTNVFVAHGRQLSQYYFKDKSFILRDEHFTFSDYIQTIFKIKVDPSQDSGLLKIGVLLENGEFYTISSTGDQSDHLSWKLQNNKITYNLDDQDINDIDKMYQRNLEAKKPVFEIPGQIFSYTADPVHFNCNIVLTINVWNFDSMQANSDPNAYGNPEEMAFQDNSNKQSENNDKSKDKNNMTDKYQNGNNTDKSTENSDSQVNQSKMDYLKVQEEKNQKKKDKKSGNKKKKPGDSPNRIIDKGQDSDVNQIQEQSLNASSRSQQSIQTWQENQKKLQKNLQDQDKLNSKKLDLRLWAAKNGVKIEAKAFIIYNDEIVDITQQLIDLRITPMDGDQVNTVVHDLKLNKQEDLTPLRKQMIRKSSYFIYYQISQKRINLIQCQMLDDGIKLTKEFSIKFDLKYILESNQDLTNINHRSRQMYDDLDQKKFRIIAGIYSINYLMVFTKINGYRIKIQASTEARYDRNLIDILPEINWKSIYISDFKHTYILKDNFVLFNSSNMQNRNASKKIRQRQGLDYQNIESLFDEDNIAFGDQYKDVSMQLLNAQVGIQSKLDYGISQMRLAFISNYYELKLIPSLHTNQISMIDQKNTENFLAIKQVQDAFYALTNETSQRGISSILITWDIMTGKKVHEYNCSKHGQNFANFQRFQSVDADQNICGLYEKHLLVSKQKQRIDEKLLQNYYEIDRLQPLFDGQSRYVKQTIDVNDFYEFKMIEIVDHKNVQELFTFIHPRYKDNKQNLYFNISCDVMIEWLNFDHVFLYHKVSIESDESKFSKVPKVTWKLVKRLQYLWICYGSANFLEQVSPDFSKFIDVDQSKRRYLIRDMKTEQIISEVRPYLMQYSEDPSEQIFRLKWADVDLLKLMNQEGVEKLIEVSTFDFNMLEFNIQQNIKNDVLDTTKNFYLNRAALDPEFVTERLIRKSQIYKSQLVFGKIENQSLYFQLDKHLYENLFSIDFQDTLENQGNIKSDLSFSFILWRIVEQLLYDEILISDIEDEVVKQLSFAIFPGGLTWDKILNSKADVIDKIYLRSLNDPEDLNSLKYMIPFYPDLNDMTSIDHCLINGQFKTINTTIKYLSGYPMDHNSRYISRSLPTLLEYELQTLPDYLNSRLYQTKQVQKITRQIINEESKTPGLTAVDVWSQMKYINQLFVGRKKDTLKKLQHIQVWYIDIREMHEFTDLSKEFFQALSNTGQWELFNINSIKNLILFQWPIVKEHIIKFQLMPSVFHLVITTLYTSYFMHERMYSLTINDSNIWISYIVMEETLVVFSLYFLSLEFLQIKEQGLNYLSSIWNFIDIIPPLIQIGLFSTSLSGHFENQLYDEWKEQQDMINKLNIRTFDYNFYTKGEYIHITQYFAILMSLSTLCQWFKLFYFLRILESTGFLVRAIISCIKDMRFFLVILLVFISAFGDSFKVMSMANADEKDQFIDGALFMGVYNAFKITLGEFGLIGNFGKLGNAWCNILFLLNTLLTSIIMLNLFIAIISDSFDRVNSQGQKASFREKAGLIAENQFLISKESKARWVQRDKFLIWAQKLHTNEQDMYELGSEDSTKICINQETHKLIDRVESQQKQVLKDINHAGERVRRDFNRQIEQIKQDISLQPQEKKTEDIRAINKLSPINWKDLKVLIGSLNEKEIAKKAKVMKKMEKKLGKDIQTLALGILPGQQLIQTVKRTSDPIYNLISDNQNAYTIKQTSYLHIQFEILSGSIQAKAYSIQFSSENQGCAPAEWKVYCSKKLAQGQDIDFQLIHQVDQDYHFKRPWQRVIFKLPQEKGVTFQTIKFEFTQNQGQPDYSIANIQFYN